RSARGIVLFEPRMLPAVRAPVTTFVTIPTRSISRYGGRWVNLLPSRDGASQEGELHDARRMQGPSDVDIQRSPDGGGRLVHGSERDPHSKGGRHRTTRHRPDFRSPQEDPMPVSRDSSILHADADKPLVIVPRPLPSASQGRRSVHRKRWAPLHAAWRGPWHGSAPTPRFPVEPPAARPPRGPGARSRGPRRKRASGGRGPRT